ncbi:cytochrome d ubiquinol oxidase subunit II [Acetobacter estunensis]|uniref:cytochrome d ubiquinol oxidase subunit II n=1 Tax=Acetobacter estunensis TaxID=104097 RepID=UPI001C2D5AEE|nr:cytochrome d ubiquinol oxidase subunit II [Acetobacter estunensis]MBV1838010.1 cytochrome d ubiquinol oxidase subunit II [Acetobacter estunensis]
MDTAAYWLPVVWGVILAVAITIYVVLDGFDLGIGILFGLEQDRDRRDVMINTIAPTWDGNETWMVLGGAVLYGVFPGAYSVLLPALYLPILLMLIALIFRGVAFEFRVIGRSYGYGAFWDFGFMAGSFIAAFCQGAILGGVIQGVSVTEDAFSGGPFDWLTPFSIFCGLAVACGYTLLGACWLIWRTVGDLQQQCRRWAKRLAPLFLISIGLISSFMLLIHVSYLHRWTDMPDILFVAPVPVLVLILAIVFWRSLSQPEAHKTPFACVLGWFLLCLSGFGISIWPYAVPPKLTLWDVSSPPSSQLFQLVGTVIIVPVILGYTIWSYRIFRGKVTAAGSHH